MLSLHRTPMSIKAVHKKKSVKLVAPIAWFGAINAITLVGVVFLIITSFSKVPVTNFKYSIFSAKPLVLGATSSRLESGDARAAAIDQYFDSYNCPMEDLGEVFVKEADKNNIPYWLVAAVSFQESNCGKKTPEPGGVESYNAWGWGVYGDNVKMFDDWEHGISVVSKYFNEKFYSKGITEPCDIMKIYTPPSKGSWCAGIEYFRDGITQYRSPNSE